MGISTSYQPFKTFYQPFSSVKRHNLHGCAPHEDGHAFVHFLHGDVDSFASVFELFGHVDGPPFPTVVVNDAPKASAEVLIGDSAVDFMRFHDLVISD